VQAIGERENKQLNLLLMDIMDSIIRGQDPVSLASSASSTAFSGKSPSRSSETEPGMHDNTTTTATTATAATDGNAAPLAGKAIAVGALRYALKTVLLLYYCISWSMRFASVTTMPLED
jgi:hypothetical protein